MESKLHMYAIMLWAFLASVFKDKLHLDTNHLHGFQGLCMTALGFIWHSDVAKSKVGQLQGKILEFEAKLAALVKPAAAALLAMAVLTMIGCANMSQLSDQDLAAFVQTQASQDVEDALTIAAAADPAAADRIKADALAAKAILDGPIAQLFAGGTTGQVTAAAMTTAKQLLSKQIAGMKNGTLIVTTANLALSPLLIQLQLPQNPATALSDRTRNGAASFFIGLSKGIGNFAVSR